VQFTVFHFLWPGYGTIVLLKQRLKILIYLDNIECDNCDNLPIFDKMSKPELMELLFEYIDVVDDFNCGFMIYTEIAVHKKITDKILITNLNMATGPQLL
jgi:hypothetical protein